uniref:ATP synthase F0 subunit 8 n=1 Tax=Haemaphysalis punctata TaxID=49204 RepID=UPI001FAEA22F|nr:ATP synthase F0 subunit 8 [Haemaphysalis punctata]UNO53939.1 ATP synthase F0 subunit 8 [Haemaphysalis punctata]
MPQIFPMNWIIISMFITMTMIMMITMIFFLKNTKIYFKNFNKNQPIQFFQFKW